MIFVYKIKNTSAESPLDDFFIVTLDDTSDEVVWGVGSNEEEAMENAADVYDRIPPHIDPNPFKIAMKTLSGEEL